MLLFYNVSAHDPAPSVLADRGLLGDEKNGVQLFTSLDALPEEDGPVLVVEGCALPQNGVTEGARSVCVSMVPPDALQNAAPYRPPRPVTAGGGYVVCPLPDDVAVLTIFRRGVWDLPKGTKDGGESIVACAKREVQEEVGIGALEVVRSLGTTRHGYDDGDHYAVKTTHWYLMRTPEQSFQPDRHEGIKRVAPARWRVVREHVGYDTLRCHMDRVERDVRTTLEG